MFKSGIRKDGAVFKFLYFGCLVGIALSLTAMVRGAQSAPAAPSTATQQKTAAEVFKNIQVLKDIPASQLIPGMQYITVALGVQCEFCHVKPFDKDEKRQKQTARQMMRMLFEINKANFKGRPEVSCYTCHRGHAGPLSVAALPANDVPAAPIPPSPSASTPALPSVDQLLAKYAEALGGQAALDEISSRVIKGKQTSENKTSNPFEIYQKGPDKALTVTTTEHGPIYTGYDGAKVWTTGEHGHVSIIASAVSHREAEINPVAALRLYTNTRVLGRGKIGNREVIAMRGLSPDQNFEILFFDADSGLLVRRSVRVQTVFGALPLQIDYSDYRKVNGVAVPFKTSLWTAQGSVSRVVNEVKDNVAINDAKFEKAPNKS